MSSELYVSVITDFKPHRKALNPDVLHRKYIDEGLSLRQIANQEMSSKESVRSALLRSDVKLRGKSRHHGNPGQLKYGMKRKGQHQSEHKQETRVIYAVRQMRDEGLSFRAIARCLDQMKVPTKNKGRKWHPEMVRRVLVV